MKLFTLPKGVWNVPVRLRDLFVVFAIYFGGQIAMGFFFGLLIGLKLISSSNYTASLYFISEIFVILLLSAYIYSLPRKIQEFLGQKPFSKSDLIATIKVYLICLVAYLVAAIILYSIAISLSNTPELPDQEAIAFAKSSFKQPYQFAMAFITLVFFAPLIEETLFRGFIQSFIRRFLGSKKAILLTSLIFSSMHFTMSQGLRNITLIGSLFVFSLFLGFIYERQRNLLASITLHFLFNLNNLLIVFLGKN
jgi:membrane protease YdiL (CAAX protease family)